MTVKKTMPEKSEPAVDTTTEAYAIWTEIKDLPISMFGLPNQTVEQYCKFIAIEPGRCFLTMSSSATLPALETTLQAHYDQVFATLKKKGKVAETKLTVEAADKFMIVSRVSLNPYLIKK